MSQAIVIASRYRLEDYLGSTLLSRVYRAREVAQDRMVALRLFPPFLNEEPGLLDHFLYEVRKVRHLNHPGILPVLDLEWDETFTCLVMEYMANGSLEERLWGRLPLPAALEIIKQIAQTLSQVRQQGIFHGDIKLSNIFITETGRVLISDFGIALLRQGVNPLLRASLTSPRPYHLPPEQLEGAPVDGRNDVFSLGVLLFQLLTPTSRWGQLSHLPPLPLSPQDPSLPPALDQVIAKATASNPQERYQEVGEMLPALEAAVGEQVMREVSPPHLMEALASPSVSAPMPLPTYRPEMPQWMTIENLVEKEQRRVRRYSRLRYVYILALVFLALVTMSSQAPRLPPQPVSSLTSASLPGQWAMYQRDPAHSGYLPEVSAPFKGELKWKFTADSSQPIFSTPAVQQGVVYLFTGGPQMVAVDAFTGEEKWHWPTPGPVNSSPALANGLLFVGFRDGRVVAINTQTGEQAWEFATAGYIYSSPTVWQGVLFVGSSDGKLYALDAQRGSLIWAFATPGRIVSSPAVGGGVVGVGSSDGNVYVVDARSGKKRIGYITGRSVDASPAIDGSTLYIGASRRLRALDMNATESRYEKTLLKWWTQIYLLGLAPPVPSQSGFIWSTGLSGELLSAPAIAGDLVYIGTARGYLYAVDKTSGEIRWQFNAQAPILASPIVAGNTLLVGDGEGRLHALNARTGDQLWQFATPSRVMNSAVVAHGLIFFTTVDGNLYALE